MGYKVGDEVFVKAKIVKAKIISTGEDRYLVETQHEEFCAASNEMYKIPDMTAGEAWKLARKITCGEKLGGISERKLAQIFGTSEIPLIMTKYAAKEVEAKIKEWEEKNEFKVGDVVCVSLGNEGESDYALVTCVHENDWYDLIMKNGLGWTYVDGDKIRKTGRHIDISGILKKIGGDEQ